MIKQHGDNVYRFFKDGGYFAYNRIKGTTWWCVRTAGGWVRHTLRLRV